MRLLLCAESQRARGRGVPEGPAIERQFDAKHLRFRSSLVHRRHVIRNRPKELERFDGYAAKMSWPVEIDWGLVPQPINLSLVTLDGIQPVTGTAAKATDGIFSAYPSDELIAFYRERSTRFQMIFVLMSGIHFVEDGKSRIVPYKISVMPASKRGLVSETSTDGIAAIAQSGYLESKLAYLNFDPFLGEWGMFGEAEEVVGNNPNPGWADEIGLTLNGYFLASEYDSEDICFVDIGIPDGVRRNYLRHQRKLLFRSFRRLQTRSVWGVENALELFLFQELVYRGLRPIPQMIIQADGQAFPSLYDLWWQRGIQGDENLVTEADFWFPAQRVAVFCDGAVHSRRVQKVRDQEIDARLEAVGVTSLRVPSKSVLNDIVGAGDAVAAALDGKV